MLDTIPDGGSGPWLSPRTTVDSNNPFIEPDLAESWVTDEGVRRLVARAIPCRSNDPELWFAERAADLEQAKALCKECPLIRGCLDGALDRGEPWGVWGGEVLVDGAVVARKRGRGRPSKAEIAARQAVADQDAIDTGAA